MQEALKGGWEEAQLVQCLGWAPALHKLIVVEHTNKSQHSGGRGRMIRNSMAPLATWPTWATWDLVPG